MVDCLATEPQYLAHCAPVWAALPDEHRGAFYTPHTLRPLARSYGIEPSIDFPGGGSEPILVAGWKDELLLERSHPVIYLEHGAGQTYCGVPESPACGDSCYSGSGGHDGVELFLCPNDAVVARWREAYPWVPAVAVGCPKLDRWIGARAPGLDGLDPVAAISFHSRSQLCDETWSSFDHYRPFLTDQVTKLRAAGVHVIGHGHPRLWTSIKPFWESIGVEAVQSFEEVIARADVYACDNSSSIPEFAAVAGPVVWINGPHFRRHVNHGGRFWEWPDGQVQCDDPADLASSVLRALQDPPQVADARQRMLRLVYSHRDGTAARRAADAIVSVSPTIR